MKATSTATGVPVVALRALLEGLGQRSLAAVGLDTLLETYAYLEESR